MTTTSSRVGDELPELLGFAALSAASVSAAACAGANAQVKYRIEVVASQNVFKDPTDADIAVCGGDKISWFINSPTGVIKIVFTDSYADQLFENGPTSLQSHPGSTTSDIDEQKVKPHAATTVYKYNIQVQDGSNKGEMDPHVIPMGN